jgi:hypothetical protein
MFMTMSLPEGREITWTDGKLSGDEDAIYTLTAVTVGDALVTPEGPRVRFADWQADPYAFQMLAFDRFAGAKVTSSDVPPMPGGP